VECHFALSSFKLIRASTRRDTFNSVKFRFVQVEARENQDLRGKPSAVVQYNAWKGGGIIAVNYEARAAGVTR
jgi:nucleotidyltransferase/DNA polymerase involved in DNA repair